MALQNPVATVVSDGGSKPFSGSTMLVPRHQTLNFFQPRIDSALPAYVPPRANVAPPFPNLLHGHQIIEKTSSVDQKTFDEAMKQNEDDFKYFDEKITMLEIKNSEYENTILELNSDIRALHDRLKKVEAFHTAMISKTQVRPSSRSPRPRPLGSSS